MFLRTIGLFGKRLILWAKSDYIGFSTLVFLIVD